MGNIKSYPRTYRYMSNNFFKSAIYFIGIFILPLFLILIPNIDKITYEFSWRAADTLTKVIPGSFVSIAKTHFITGNSIYFPSLNDTYMKPEHLMINIIVVSLIFIFFITGKRKERPFSIFIAFETSAFLINALYFVFKAEYFPYTIYDFSELYIRQQIWTWITFIILYGIGTSCLGDGSYFYRILIGVMLIVYSVVFSFVRYILFMYILYNYSMLYMMNMYFTFGPLFDFLFLVEAYGFILNHIIKVVGKENKKEVWLWS